MVQHNDVEVREIHFAAMCEGVARSGRHSASQTFDIYQSESVVSPAYPFVGIVVSAERAEHIAAIAPQPGPLQQGTLGPLRAMAADAFSAFLIVDRPCRLQLCVDEIPFGSGVFRYH